VLEYKCADNYFNIKEIDTIVAKTKRCSFSTHKWIVS